MRHRNLLGLVAARLRKLDLQDLLRNIFALFATSLILVLSVVQTIGSFSNIPNTIPPSILVVVGSMIFIGSKALSITRLDWIFGVWLLLAFASHIYATCVLGRDDFRPDTLNSIVYFILDCYLLYRAVFCIVLVNPKNGSLLIVGMLVVILCGVGILGVMQRYGPGKSFAITVGSHLSRTPKSVVDAAAISRPTGVYEGPNMLGYAVSIMVCCVLGWSMIDLPKITLWKTFTVTGLCGLAIFAALASQSRQTVLILALCPIFFGLQLIRFARDRRTVFLFSVLSLVGLTAGGVIVLKSKSDYLASVSHTGIQHDVSFEVRVMALQQLKEIAIEIAPFGAGISQVNYPNGELTQGYNHFTVIDIDNEWANIYEAFGVWGPLFLMTLFLCWYRHAASLLNSHHPEARAIARIALWILLLDVLISPSGVRVFKLDPACFAFIFLGAASGWHWWASEPLKTTPVLGGQGLVAAR